MEFGICEAIASSVRTDVVPTATTRLFSCLAKYILHCVGEFQLSGKLYVCFGLILLKNSKIREARISRERMINRKSPPPTSLTGVGTPVGGQCQILADPSAENPYRVCVGNFWLVSAQIRSFSTVSARSRHSQSEQNSPQ